MRKILITCFGPFPGMGVNPTAQLLRALMRSGAVRFERLGVTLAAHALPTVFAAIKPELEALMKAERPDAALHLGVAGNRKKIRGEAYGRKPHRAAH